MQGWHFVRAAALLSVLAVVGLVAAVEWQAVSAVGNPVRLSAGYGNSCALTDRGGAVCWGLNMQGALGNGEIGGFFRSRTGDVRGLDHGLTAVVTGSSLWGGHACALLNTQSVSCWGDNTYGQLGTSSAADCTTNHPCSKVPLPVTSLGSQVTAIDSGGTNGSYEGHTCAALTSSEVRCWGGNGSGQLGNGTTNTVANPNPTAVCTAANPCQALTGVTAVTTGKAHSCALLTSGTAKCWGSNGDHRLGTGGSETTPQPTAATVCVDPTCTPLAGITAISAGGEHTCALIDVPESGDGLKCWGDNEFGQLGNGDSSRTDQQFPVSVVGLTNGVVAVSAGWYHTCALLIDGKVRCWGQNHLGQLGRGTTSAENTPNPTPAEVLELNGVAVIDTGYWHTCALTTIGIGKCWGDNRTGQLGNGAGGVGVISTKPSDVTDGDACKASREAGGQPSLGGQRDPLNIWDFFDTPDGNNVRDGIIEQVDIDRVSARFGATDDLNGDTVPDTAINRYSDPLSPPPPSGYHPAFDRSDPLPGADPWDMGPPNGTIDLFTDIFGVANQEGHICV